MTEPISELQAYKDLLNDCHGIHLNLNDTFFRAADGCTVHPLIFAKLMPVMQTCGASATVNALVAIKRGYDPLERWIRPEYLAAKEQIQALINNGLKLDLYFNEDE